MKTLLLSLLILFSQNVIACPLHQTLMGVTPAHFEYMIKADDQTTSTVTEESFNLHFYNVFFQNYQSMQTSSALPVVPEADWIKPYFTAYTAEIDGVIKMGFWGGMARIPGMNQDAVALITCHEVGHVLGGHPYFKNPNFAKFSSEGQSDFYATSVCLKKYFASEANTLNELKTVQNKSIQKKCSQFSNQLDRAVCYRSLKAITGFISVLNHLKKNNGVPDLEGKDTTVVAETYVDDYPANQCRVDTLLAGVFNQPRPACWFKN